MSVTVHWDAGACQWGVYALSITGGCGIDEHSQRFEENSTLEGLLGELIIPAVVRPDLVIREKGIVSLGLCCMIARVRSLIYLRPSRWLTINAL